MFVTQGAEEMGVRMLVLYLDDGWMIQVIIMIVRYHDSINDGDILNVAGCLGISLWTQPGERTTPVAEDWIKQDPQATRELDKITGVTEPGSPESAGCPTGKEAWFHDCDRWGCCVWRFALAR